MLCCQAIVTQFLHFSAYPPPPCFVCFFCSPVFSCRRLLDSRVFVFNVRTNFQRCPRLCLSCRVFLFFFSSSSFLSYIPECPRENRASPFEILPLIQPASPLEYTRRARSASPVVRPPPNGPNYGKRRRGEAVTLCLFSSNFPFPVMASRSSNFGKLD